MLIDVKPSWAAKGRTGRVYRYKNLQWFACEGQIVVIDNHPLATDIDSPVADMGRGPRERVILPDDWRERGYYFRQKALARDHIKYPWQRQELQAQLQLAADVEESVREAKQMGDPNDPAVQDWWTKHRRKGTPLPGPARDLDGYRKALEAIDRECRQQGIEMPRNLPNYVARARPRLTL